MAVTLAQAAIDARELGQMEGALVQLFDYFSPVIKMIPMEKIDGRAFDYEREVQLPSVTWRALNQPYSDSTGITNPYREYLKILGGEVWSDVHFQRTAPKQATNTLKRQITMKMQALSNEWDRSFFEGSELASPNEMVGLRPRVSGSQLILNAVGGGPLTLAKLRELVNAVPFAKRTSPGFKRGEGIRKVLFMSRAVRSIIDDRIDNQSGALRVEKEKNEFGDQVEVYNGAEIVVVEQTGTGATILGFDEDPGDGTADTASIYCVAFGEGLVRGIYNNGNVGGRDRLFDVDEWDTIPDAPRAIVRFEGSFGMVIEHPRAAARLYGITAA